MRSNKKKTLLVILLLVIISIFALSRCTPNQSESLSIETPASSPTVTPSTEEATPAASPEVTPPAASNTPSPTTKPSVKPSVISTKPASPTPRKSVKPTSSPREVTEPDTTVRNDANGDGLPDYIKPTVTFTNITCEVLEDKFVYKYDINFLGGDNYELPAEVRGGFRMELREGKFWFSISEAELRHPRYVGPIIYKINSVEDRSWTYFERKSLSKKNWSYGDRGIQSPLTLSPLDTGIPQSFPKPDIEVSLCKK